MADAPLAGIRVLEIGGRFSQYGGRLLAALGATVFLLEPPDGSNLRRIGPPATQQERLFSLSFLHFNSGKRSISTKAVCESGAALLMALAADADIVLIDLGAAALAGLGQRLRDAHPTAIVVEVSTNTSGTDTEGFATDLELVARGGLAHLTGSPQGPPMRPGGDQSLHLAGLHAAVGSLMALLDRDASGAGQSVAVRALRALPMATHTAMVDFALTGEHLDRQGAHHRSPADGLYRCQDGWVVLASGSWDALAAWLEEDGAGAGLAITSRRWRDARRRVEALSEIDAALDHWLQDWKAEELEREAHRRRVMLEVVRVPEVILEDPQLEHREFFIREATQDIKIPGLPVRFAKGAPARLSQCPGLGEANGEEFKGGLGVTRRQWEALKANGAV